jgi:GNAT superfamily N-acetyltransferase
MSDHERMTVVRLTATHPWFSEAVDLFDAYRQHYGANPAPEAVEEWMRDQMVTDRLRLYAAGDEEHVRGILTASVIPASLTLRTVWLIRDLFIDPGARRAGLGRELLTHVAEAAREEGAHRLSLQTEPDNVRALQLYAKAGFEPVTEIVTWARVL